MQYTNTWLPWLQTITGVTSNFVSKTYDQLIEMGGTYFLSSAVTQTGPIITISISDRTWDIKTLSNSHTLNVTWKNEHGRTSFIS